MEQPTYRIYKISNDDTDNIYIGSTALSPARRWSRHLSHSRRRVAGFPVSYTRSSDLVFGRGAKLEIVETLPPGSTRRDAEIREAYHIRLNEDICINEHVPKGTPRVVCGCGCDIAVNGKTQHESTRKHHRLLAALQAAQEAIDDAGDDIAEIAADIEGLNIE